MKAAFRNPFGAGFVVLCALAALPVSAVLILSRLPRSTEFILPRRPGFPFFRLAIKVAQSPGLRGALSWLALAAVLFAALAALWGLYRELFSRPWEPRTQMSWLARGLACAAGLYVLARLSFFALVLGLDLIQNVWFAPESLDPLEPLATFAVLFLVAAAFLGAAAALLRWFLSSGAEGRARLKEAALLASALLVWTALLYGWAASRYDIRRKNVAEAAGFQGRPLNSRVIVMLTEKEGRPDYSVYPVETPYIPEFLEALERYLAGPRTVFTRPALRSLYDGYTIGMDAGRLRPALFLGHLSGDPVARLLLLDNLAYAPPDAGAVLFLAGLADEREYRIGSRAAAQIAIAYAHIGEAQKAAYWQERASQGEGAIPKGLLTLPPSGGALKPGIVRGSLRGIKRAKVGLYLRRDPSSPYAYGLGPSQLVDSAETDAKGRFEFKGLAAGDYYLALSIDSEPRSGKDVHLRGHRGDIRLTPERPQVELPPLELGWF